MDGNLRVSLPLDDLRLNSYKTNLKQELLQEISNVGVGHAATALSQLLNRKVNMSVPRINIIKVQDMYLSLSERTEELMAGVFLQSQESEDTNFTLLLLFDSESIKDLLAILRKGSKEINLHSLDEISFSIIKETGNILLLHTITAINSFTDSQWFPSPATMTLDTIQVILKEIATEIDEIFLVECDIFPEDGSKLKGNILLFPNSIAMQLLMKRLYGEGWEKQ